MQNIIKTNQIFKDNYPSEAVDFCLSSKGTENACSIVEIVPDEQGRKLFKIKKDTEIVEEGKKLSSLHEKIINCKSYLRSTDWYIVRKYERGLSIPDDVVAKRQQARDEIDLLRDQMKTETIRIVFDGVKFFETGENNQ